MLVWGLTWVHLASIQYGGSTQRWLTYLKVGSVLVIIGTAFFLGAGSWGYMESTVSVEPSLATIFASFLFV